MDQPLNPKFSVITVVKNNRAGLKKTAQSVLCQSYKNFEYIVIDGQSIDGTLEELDILSQHATCLSEADSGISDAFNKGLKLAQGEWINFLNAGDTFARASILDEVAAIINQNTHYKIVTGFSKFGSKTIPKRLFQNSEPLHIKAMLSHQASFIQRPVFNEVGFFDLTFKIRMDYDLWLRILQKYEFYLTPNIWVEYNNRGISSQDENLELFFKEGKYANEKNLTDNFRGINILLEIQYYKARIKALIAKCISLLRISLSTRVQSIL